MPVERARAAVRLFDAVAVGVISVIGADAVFAGGGDAVFGVVGGAHAVRAVGGHVSGRVITVAGELIIDERSETEILCRALGDEFLRQVSPGIIAVIVAPVFCLAIHRHHGAVCSRVLRRGQAI